MSMMTPDMMAGEEPAAEAGDLSQGYTIEISVLPDGTYQVSPPESLPAEAEEEAGAAPGSEIGDTYETIGAALKQVLLLVKENPVGGGDQANFEAGFNATR